ncbi:MAG: hypothetical protein ACRBB3_06555 [Alphaproteobacteria bacterium]
MTYKICSESKLTTGYMRCAKLFCLSFICVITFSIGTAWSYENMYRFSTKSSNVITKPNKPLPAVTNLCKKFLKFAHKSTPQVIKSDSQRTVGKVAMLGIIIGARFVVEPNINNDLSRNTDNHYAKAIAEYRKCQKEQALVR